MPELIGGKKVFGVAGWKDSGKTTLVTNLIRHFSGLGLSVSTLKHAHHAFDVDHEGTDSFRHRAAGAGEVVIISDHRWAIMTNAIGHDKPDFEAMLARMSPADLVLVEGYKREAHPKLEVLALPSREALWQTVPNCVAIAADMSVPDCPLPRFQRDDIVAIANYILDYWNIQPGGAA